MAAVGTGVANRLPGAWCAALPGTSVVGTLPAWQLAQLADVGMCEVEPWALLGGITTMLLIP